MSGAEPKKGQAESDVLKFARRIPALYAGLLVPISLDKSRKSASPCLPLTSLPVAERKALTEV